MNYLEKFKSIYENYSWCWLDTDYLVDTHMIANAVVYLNEVFSHKSYELNSKKQTFHNREIYKYLKNNKQVESYMIKTAELNFLTQIKDYIVNKE